MPLNPFLYGAPVIPTAFVGRRREVRRIVGRILNQGQSSALVGEPRLGKTSLLHYLQSPAHRAELYGESHATLIFSFCDSQTFGAEFTVAHFWRQALQPLKTQLVDGEKESALAKQYQTCNRQGFDSFRLESLFQQVRQQGHRLVLLLDEFDMLLHHPKLNKAEFFGGLRSLASNSQGALAVVIASRLPLARLNAETQSINPTGSPYFNTLAEVTLGALAESDIDRVLAPGQPHFSADDQRYLRRLSGGHPYLLQAAASALWEAHEEGLVNRKERERYVFEQLYQEHDQHFANTWQVWRPEVRQAFTSVALVNAKEEVLKEKKFEINTLLDGLTALSPELKELESAGVLLHNPAAIGSWNVTQGIMLAWLVDELVRASRSDDDFAKWLRKSETEGLWTKGQREQAQGFIKGIGKGAISLAERLATAYSFGGGLAENMKSP